MAHPFDQPAQGQVVLGHHRGRRRPPSIGAMRVIVGQPHDDELRQRARFFKTVQLLQKAVGSFGVGIAEIPAAEERIEMALQRL